MIKITVKQRSQLNLNYHIHNKARLAYIFTHRDNWFWCSLGKTKHTRLMDKKYLIQGKIPADWKNKLSKLVK